jgi:hypothetical protein
MKMLIITSIREDLRAVSRIMDKAGIEVFSVSETIGHKTAFHEFMPDNWFGKSDDGTEALFFFSFTGNEQAKKAIGLVKEFNTESKVNFPIRAFVMPVEEASY